MRFEERVTVLCAQAVATDDDAEVRKILAELRLVLHQHIEQLRSRLLIAYTNSVTGSDVFQHQRQKTATLLPVGTSIGQEPGGTTPRTWQRLVHEIAGEKDYERALRLSQELSRLLQRQAENPGLS